MRKARLPYTWHGNIRELENVTERRAVYIAQFHSLTDDVSDGVQIDFPELYGSGDCPARLSDEPVPWRLQVRCASVDTVQRRRLVSDMEILVDLQTLKGCREAASAQLDLSCTALWQRLSVIETGKPEAQTQQVFTG